MADNWYLYKKDVLESILYMCGITHPRYNSVCASCASDMDHSSFMKCRNEYSQQMNLAKFRCLIIYYEKHKQPYPAEFQGIVLIVNLFEKASKHWERLPKELLNIPFTLNLTPSGELDLEKASRVYRSHLLTFLTTHNSTVGALKKQGALDLPDFLKTNKK